MSHFLNDANRFILKIHQIADDTPLQIYSAGLLFTPQSSRVYQQFKAEIPAWAVQISGFDNQWSSELQTLEGHEQSVEAVTFSPDGQLLASASDDSSVILWHSRTGAIQQRFYNPKPLWAKSVTFSHDSRLVAAGFEDNKVRVWDTATSQLLCILPESNMVWSVEFSPKSHLLATGVDDFTVNLWDIEKMTPRKSLLGHSGPVKTVAFSPDGMMLASGSNDHTTRIWDLGRGSLIFTLESNPEPIQTVAFSSDGRLLACGSGCSIEIWDIERGKINQTLKCASGHGPVVSVAFSRSNTSLASCTHEVQIWDLVTGCIQRTLIGHSSSPNSVAFSPDGQILASSSHDRSLRLWDMTVGLSQSRRENSTMIAGLSWSPDGNLLASVTRDHTVRLHSAETGTLKHTLAGNMTRSSSVTFSPDSKQLACGFQDQTIRLWSTGTGSLQGILNTHSDNAGVLVFSPDGLQLASGSAVSGSADMIVRLWDLATGAKKHTFHIEREVLSIAFSPCGQFLAAGGFTGHVGWLHVWNVAAGTLNFDVYEPGVHIPCVAFSPDSQVVASYDVKERTMKMRDSRTGQLQGTLVESECNAEHIDAENISYVNKGQPQWNVSVRKGKILFQPPNWQLELWFTKSGWFILNDRKILRLPADAKPSCSAVGLDSVALGYPSGRTSLFKLDFQHLTGAEFTCLEAQRCVRNASSQFNLQDNAIFRL